MATVRDLVDTATGWLKTFIDFFLSFVLVLVILAILFGDTFGIVENIEAIVGAFSERGVVGLIALLLFVLIYRR